MSLPLSLSTLPFVGQDNILSRVDRPGVLAISLTSRSLQNAAKRHLYRKVDDYWNQRDLFENNLRHDRRIIPLIRSFASYCPSLLRWMWLQTPPKLDYLRLQWYDIDDDTYPNSFESIPPHSQVRTSSIELKSDL